MSRSALSVVRLLKELRQVTDWHMLGLYLEIPPQELDKIRQQFLSEGVERCKAAMFDLWLRRNQNASWDNVATALEQAGEAVLASEIRKGCLSLGSYSPLPTDTAAVGGEFSSAPEARLTLELKKPTVKKFTKLESKFAVLASDVKSALEEKVTPRKLHSFLEERLDQTIELCPTTSITDLFKSISPYYCFLNTTLLENIIDEFIGEPLQYQLDEYERQLEDFTSSTKIALLEMINTKRQLTNEEVPLVILKLPGRYLTVTIKRFQELVNHIFEVKSNALSNIRVESGCICITWITHESAIPSLIALAQEKAEFMMLVGVLKLTVGKTIIFEQTSEQEEEKEEMDDNLALMRATTSDCTAAVEFLLSAGANPNCTGMNGRTPLIVAIMKGSQDTVKVLLEANADPNLPNSSGLTPLMWACSRGHEPIVNLLLQSGADPSTHTVSGLTALLCVSYNDRHLGIVRSLLAAGAAVNAQDGEGWSALMKACYNGCSEIVELLLQYNADVQLSTSGGQQGYTALMIASQRQLAHAVELLLASGADPNLRNESGSTALMFSCATKTSLYPDHSIPTLLLSAGADPNAVKKDGSTALMIAACNGYESGVRVLLNVQADVNAQNISGNTALHLSAMFGNLSITDLLLSAGADTSLVNETEDTAFDIALSSDHHEMHQLLLMHTKTKPNAPSETTSVEWPALTHQTEQL